MKLSRLILLLTLCFFSSTFAVAQEQSTKRRVSVTLKNQDPITGYLIRSDADVIVIGNEDGTFQRIPLDDVTMIFIVPKAPQAKATPPPPQTDEAPLDKNSQLAPEAPDEPTPTTTDTPSTGGTVNVRGYYRKDGTYVKPHTRRAPRKRN